MPPTDPIAAVAHPDPYPFYHELATHRPLYRDDRIGMWVASSATAVQAVLASGGCRVRPATEPVPRSFVQTAVGHVFQRLVRMTDSEFHRCMKPAITAALDDTDAAAVERASRQAIRSLLDERGANLDCVALDELMFQLPVEVVGALLGLPTPHMPSMASWTGDFVRCLAPAASPRQIARGTTAATELLGLFRALLATPNRDGSDGLLWRLAHETRRAGCADVDSIAANALGLLSQTYEATAGLIGNTLVASARHHTAYRSVAADRGRTASFVREVLRQDPPIQNTRRFAVEDVTIDGHRIESGDAILVVIAAANRDRAANPEPDRFEVDRPHRRLFAFGAARHACPGEMIATVIAGTALELLRPRIRSAERLAGPITYRPSANARIPMFGDLGRDSRGPVIERGAP